MDANERCVSLLHLLALKPRADLATLRDAAGVRDEELQIALEELAGEGLAAGEPGRPVLTEAGRRRLETVIEGERARLPAAVLASVYGRFLRENGALKEVVTAWQLRPGPGGVMEPNDHADPHYDALVRESLARLDDRFRRVLDELVALVPRWASYRRRFDAAIAQVDAGDGRFIASPLLDSYHTIWFELHEELLRLQGLDRRTEEAMA